LLGKSLAKIELIELKVAETTGITSTTATATSLATTADSASAMTPATSTQSKLWTDTSVTKSHTRRKQTVIITKVNQMSNKLFISDLSQVIMSAEANSLNQNQKNKNLRNSYKSKLSGNKDDDQTTIENSAPSSQFWPLSTVRHRANKVQSNRLFSSFSPFNVSNTLKQQHNTSFTQPKLKSNYIPIVIVAFKCIIIIIEFLICFLFYLK
jgi:hypothetical protein